MTSPWAAAQAAGFIGAGSGDSNSRYVAPALTAGMSHSIDFTTFPDGTALSHFDTGTVYSQSRATYSQNALVQLGSLTPPDAPSSVRGATYEFARAGKPVRVAGMTCRPGTILGGSTSPTFACGMLGPTGTANPIHSPAHLAVTMTGWVLSTYAASVATQVPGAAGNLSIAPDQTFSIQVKVNYAARQVTVWVPDGKPPKVFGNVPVDVLPVYPVGFSEMVVPLATDYFPQTFAWWADADRQYGLT